MKKKIFIKGTLTQKRALKQLEGALKCKTQQRLKIDNRNSKIGWETVLVKRMRKIFKIQCGQAIIAELYFLGWKKKFSELCRTMNKT